MTNRNAYILLGLGAIILLTQMGSSIWLALVAAVLLAGYVQRRVYGLLIAGSVATGLAVGSVLEFAWNWDGALLVSLGIGFLAIHRVEPRDRWPQLVGRILIGLGIVIGLATTGIIGPFWLALALLGGGFYLLRRNKGGAFSNPWVEVGPAKETAKPVDPDADATKAAKPAPTPAASVDKGDTSLDLDDPEAVTMKEAEAAQQEEAAETTAPPTEPVAQSSANKPERDEALYAALTTWRRDMSKSEERKPYLILTNASLEQIAQEKPQTQAELKDIKGIGPVKLERYGEAILSLVAQHIK